MQLMVYDKFIKLYHYHNGGKTEYYYLRSKVDWDVIKGYLDFEAERPADPTMLWPEMQVHFDIPEVGGPIFAIRNELRVWDLETGETLRASSNSDSPGGVYGVNPTQAQLVFDMPVSEITVWRKAWDSQMQSEAFIEGDGMRFTLPLENHSAHYQVDVLFEPYQGIGYDATYVFDVEYPN